MSNQNIFYIGTAWAFGITNHWGEIDYARLSEILGTTVFAPDGDADARHILNLINVVRYANSL